MEENLITLEEFRVLPEVYHQEGVVRCVLTTEFNAYISRDIPAGLSLLYVVKKSAGYDDWAIYCSRPLVYGTYAAQTKHCAEHGDKISTEKVIRSIFPCTDEVFKLYRK